MQNTPLVSIVTPAFNQGAYLAETIESVLSQDYANIEYIVLDDGSTDDTAEIISRYDGRIRSERHDNIGQARTLNKGWRMARGEYLGYLSADDLLEPDAVSRLVSELIKSPDIAVSYGDFKLIDSNGRVFRSVRTEEYDRRRLTVDIICQPGPGALFRREVFARTGGWTGKLRQVPDFEFWLRASRVGPFKRVPEFLARYRVHVDSASFSATTSDRSMEIVDVMSDYWRQHDSADARRSLATACLIAAKSHAQAGRIGASYTQWMHAVRLSPRVLMTKSAWRGPIAGAYRRIIHRFFRRNNARTELK